MVDEQKQPKAAFIKEGDVCVEIGVWKGNSASQLIKRPFRKLYLIDP